MGNRIYLVTNEQSRWLVRAASKEQAMAHIVGGRYSAAVATQENLIDMIAANCVVQVAGQPKP